MSGGSHNYICYTIESELCGQMKDAELNDLMKDIAKLAHDLEWYDSSDIGEGQYIKSVHEFKEKWFKTSRTERLKGYVDKRIEEIRKELYLLVGERVVVEDSYIEELQLSKEAVAELRTNKEYGVVCVWHLTKHTRGFFNGIGISRTTLDEVQERLKANGFDFAKEDDS